MTGLELEALALRVTDRVVAGHPVEDSFVELKAEWPADAQRAARRIAAHANEMRGHPIVWIIGIDDDAGAVVGAEKEEIGDWFAQVSRYFDQAVPDLSLTRVAHHHNVPIVALLFDTSSYPYVVTKGDKKGAFEREVPMREGTRTRSARRSEIIRLFIPRDASTQVEIYRCVVEAELYPWTPPSGGEFYWWHARLDVFAVAGDSKTLFLPAHGVKSAIEVPEGYEPVEHLSVHILKPSLHSTTVAKSGNDLIITHAGRFVLEITGICSGSPPTDAEAITLHCSIKPAAATAPYNFAIRLTHGCIAYRKVDAQDCQGYMLAGSEWDEHSEPRPFGRIPDEPSIYVQRWIYPQTTILS